LQSTGVIKAVRAIDPMPDAYYDSGDIVGLVYHNRCCRAGFRATRAFVGLAGTARTQSLANDKGFSEMAPASGAHRRSDQPPKNSKPSQ